MTHRFMSDKDAVMVVTPQAATSSPYASAVVGGAGWDRACFHVLLGVPLAGTFTGQIVDATTSGAAMATRADAPAMVNVTSGIGSQSVVEIDVPINQSRPWLSFSGGPSGTNWLYAVMVHLYRGSRQLPPTRTTQQVVEV